MLIIWLEFIFCSAVIVFCGIRLSRYGDIIAEKTGLGRAWIGLILMASVTSLPELITGISSVAIADTPNIALGDIMGSCVFNISIIVIMDMLHGSAPIFHKTEHGHILAVDDIFYTKGSLLADVSINHAVTGFMAVLMTGIAVVSLIYRLERKTFLRLGWDTIAILLAYIVNIYLLYILRVKG